MTERTKRVAAVAVVALAVVAAILLIGAITGPRHATSYGAGYQWGYRNAGAKAPSCTRAEMVTAGPVSDPRLPRARLTGDDAPHARFSRGRAGRDQEPLTP